MKYAVPRYVLDKQWYLKCWMSLPDPDTLDLANHGFFYWSTGYPALSVFSSLRQNPAVDCFFRWSTVHVEKKKNYLRIMGGISFFPKKKQINPNSRCFRGSAAKIPVDFVVSASFALRKSPSPLFLRRGRWIRRSLPIFSLTWAAPPWKNAIGKTGKSTRRDGGVISSCWCFCGSFNYASIYIRYITATVLCLDIPDQDTCK